MKNKFEYIVAGPTAQNALLDKGFEKSNPAIIGKNEFKKSFFIINHEHRLFWFVDKLGFEDANNRVKHITGKEIQPFKA